MENFLDLGFLHAACLQLFSLSKEIIIPAWSKSIGNGSSVASDLVSEEVGRDQGWQVIGVPS